MEEVIKIDHLYKSFDDGSQKIEVLKDIHLSCYQGEVLMIVGPSGCGKTTLLSCMVATLKIDSGKIWALGQNLSEASEKEILEFRAKNIGFIFQQFHLIPTLNLEENISIPLFLNGWSKEEAYQKTKQTLALVGLEKKIHQYPSQLSGGQQQRVAIARALVHDPKIVVCDEPTSSLDGKTGVAIVELLRKLAKDEGRTVILVTHDNRIFHLADRTIEMDDGRIIKNSGYSGGDPALPSAT